jgi:hypothetical protein
MQDPEPFLLIKVIFIYRPIQNIASQNKLGMVKKKILG